MLKRNILYIIAATVSMLFCSVVFYSDPELANPQINSSLFLLHDIVLACAGIAVLACFLGKERFQITLTDGGIGLMTLAGMIQNHLHQDPDITKLVLLGISYFILRVIFQQTPHALKIASGILLLTGIAECWLGFRQLYGFSTSNHAIYRLTGSFFNPGPYSGFLVTILPIATYWMLKLYQEVEDFSFRQIPAILKSTEQLFTHLAFTVSTLCFLGIITLLPASMSRSGWIAGAAGCFVVLAHRYHLVGIIQKYYRAYPRKFLVGGIAGLLLCVVAGIGMYLMKKDSADGRLLMWKVSLNVMQKNPWTGTGAGLFPGAYGQAQAEYFSSGNGSVQEELVAGSPEYGFNEYLQIGVEFGILGLILFLFICASALWCASRSKTSGTNALIGSATAMLTFALFSYPFQIIPLCVIGVILLALLVNGHLSKITLNTWQSGIFTVSLVLLAFWLIKDKKEKQAAYVAWAQEKTYFNMNIFKETVDHYRELYPQLKKEAVFLFEYGQCLSKTEQYEESNRILKEGVLRSGDPMFYNIMGKNYQALKQYSQAEKAFRHASDMVPHRLYPQYLMAKMYFECGQTEKAIETAQKLIDKTPKVMSEAIREMKEEMTKAIEEARQNRYKQSDEQELPNMAKD